MEKEEQAKREAEEAQVLAQQTDQWSSVVPPTEAAPEAGQWDAAGGDVSSTSFPPNVHNTVGPPNNGHFGANSFVPCREVVPISEVK